MSVEIAKEIHLLVDELVKLIQTYHNEKDPSKRFEILTQISSKYSRLQILLAQLVTL